MQRDWFKVNLLLTVLTVWLSGAAFAEAHGFAAGQVKVKLYSPLDKKLMKAWYKDITGNRMKHKEEVRMSNELDQGTSNMNELRRGYVNSSDGRKELDVLNRLFWGYLARSISNNEHKIIEEQLSKIDGDFEDIVDQHFKRWKFHVPSEFNGDLKHDLKKIKSIEDARIAITYSTEYIERNAKELYHRYLKRKIDGGALKYTIKNYRKNRKK